MGFTPIASGLGQLLALDQQNSLDSQVANIIRNGLSAYQIGNNIKQQRDAGLLDRERFNLQKEGLNLQKEIIKQSLRVPKKSILETERERAEADTTVKAENAATDRFVEDLLGVGLFDLKEKFSSMDDLNKFIDSFESKVGIPVNRNDERIKGFIRREGLAQNLTESSKTNAEIKKQGSTPIKFSSIEEAERADLPTGTIIEINGRKARIT